LSSNGAATGQRTQKRTYKWRRSDQAEWAEWAVTNYAEWILSLPIDTKLIILFGSYAKGTFDEDSDIDILIVADGLPPVNDAITLLTIGVPEELPAGDFEPHPYSPQAFKASLENDGKAAEALIDGQILYIDDQYREELVKAL
jgi:predicted nucleotidyltransferase